MINLEIKSEQFENQRAKLFDFVIKMNAVIALSHFCEVHGPSPIFCTQTLRDIKVDDIEVENESGESQCPGCTSLDRTIGIVSEDQTSKAYFLSTQKAVIGDVELLVKQAAVRSLSCEVTSDSKNGNVVFFGDASSGYVLSMTFQLHDSQARGLFRLFAFNVLMKDKAFLLSSQPFLVEHTNKLIDELKKYSRDVNANEEAKQSERAARLTSGEASRKPPRSLIELTANEHIFAIIHSHLAWILLMGANYLTETISRGISFTPSSIEEQAKEIRLGVNASEELPSTLLNIDISNEAHSLRKCKEIFGAHFEAICYCVLIGIQVILRGSRSKSVPLIKALKTLIPRQMHRLVNIESDEYLTPDKCRILTVSHAVAVPLPSEDIFRVDFLDNPNELHVKWLGKMPSKCLFGCILFRCDFSDYFFFIFFYFVDPMLLTKILRAVNESLLNDFVLEKQINVLVETWKK